MVPDLGVVINTSGIKVLGNINANLSKSFADIEELTSQCRFNDCTHNKELKSAVQIAFQEGYLSPERLDSASAN